MMFKIYSDIDEFIKENGFNQVLKSIKKLDNKSYLIKTNKNYLISNNGLLYFYNNDDLDEILDIIYKYNLLFRKTDNYKFVKLYAKLFYGTIKKDGYLYKVVDKNIKKAMLAGGCFWCSSYAYFNKKGIKNIYSGYAGGITHMPNYEEVKKGNTKHMETILIYYDKRKTSYKELLDIFFITIDPFDDEGQFIDRGSNYKTAIFTDSIREIAISKNKIDEVSKLFNQEVKVKLLSDTIFYLAEEYHQDYGLKNPELMQKELKESGRVK